MKQEHLLYRFISHLLFDDSLNIPGLIFGLLLSSTLLVAQTIPKVPEKVEFAGISVHLSPQGQFRVQQEIEHLYKYPRLIQADVSALRQVSPLLKPLLAKANLPDDFRFVALPFDGADTIGYWGLSKASAQYLDMRVDDTIDERYHPLISTEAVIGDLNRLQEKHRNYVIALIRYLQRTTVSGVPDRLDPTYIRLGATSPPLIWKILARKIVIELEEPTYHPTVNYLLYQYENAEGQTLNTIARRLRISEERMNAFNQWLKAGPIPTDKLYTVLVQVTPDEISTVKALVDSGLNNRNHHQPSNGFPVVRKIKIETDNLHAAAVYYTINEHRGIQAQHCDNAITLAFYGNIKVSNFFKYNDLDEESDVVRPGEIYYLERKSRRAKVPYHITQKNQTLREIAHMYGVLLSSLLTYNRMQVPQRLQVGQVLWLQTKRPAHQPVMYVKVPDREPDELPDTDSVNVDTGAFVQQALSGQIDDKSLEKGDSMTIDSLLVVNDSLDVMEERISDEEQDRLTLSVKTVDKNTVHTVTKGQTYFAVARLYGVTVKQLYNWNHLSEADVLTVGQKLIVKNSTYQQITGVHSADKGKPITNKATNIADSRSLMRNSFFHTVRAGQTLYQIAVLNKVQVKDLVRWNNLRNYIVKVGQILVLWK